MTGQFWSVVRCQSSVVRCQVPVQVVTSTPWSYVKENPAIIPQLVQRGRWGRNRAQLWYFQPTTDHWRLTTDDFFYECLGLQNQHKTRLGI
jgi:hypothetical protein